MKELLYLFGLFLLYFISFLIFFYLMIKLGLFNSSSEKQIIRDWEYQISNLFRRNKRIYQPTCSLHIPPISAEEKHLEELAETLLKGRC